MRTWLTLSLVLLLAACGSSDAGGADAGRADAAAGACTGLSLQDCRVTAGCAADLCFACSCAPQFKLCRRASDPPFQCPALGCPQPICCGSDGSCPGGGLACVPPGDSLGCGPCDPMPGSCTGDGECGGGTICEPIACSCSDQRACVPGCTGDADCGEGQSCDLGDHRCGPADCSENAPCPTEFICADGLCARASCTTDDECPGFCVDGKCFDAQGTCQSPPP
jgi:hypothetical protein